jgi:hypothetical protein
VETSGGDIQKASAAFSDGARQIQAQAQQVAASKVTAAQAGQKFAQAGDAYQKLLDKLEANVKAFAEQGTTLSQSLGDSAKEYRSSDEAGADEIGKVKA